MNKVIVSAPFGNWASFASTTSTIGTFTLKNRGGPMYRMWRCLRTLRYNRRIGGWTNKLGLPNPGIDSVDPEQAAGKIISIHGFSTAEWASLAMHLSNLYAASVTGMVPAAIELNLSCPNVPHRAVISDGVLTADMLLRDGAVVIAKLPPVRWMDYAEPLHAAGVRWFHCCNTIPSPGGGISGKPLKQYSLWAVDEIKQRWGSDVEVIGGGGVTSVEDALEYRRAGADHVALGSMLLNPFNWRKVKRIVEAVGILVMPK